MKILDNFLLGFIIGFILTIIIGIPIVLKKTNRNYNFLLNISEDELYGK